jgi:autotransporter-associated beta strand protein
MLMLGALLAPAAAYASTYRWQVDANGDWNNPSNWSVVEGPAGAGYPNLAGDVAVIENAITAARTITIPNGVTITIGRLEIDEAEPLIIAGDGTGLLAFDNLGEDAEIASQGAGAHRLGPIELRADLVVVRNGDMGIGSMELRTITESGGSRKVTKTGTGTMRFNGANTYTGVTTVVEGDLKVQSGLVASIPGDLIIGDGTGPRAEALVNITGQTAAPTSNVTVHADGRLEVAREFTSDSACSSETSSFTTAASPSSATAPN